MRTIDISMPLFPGMPRFPGDSPFAAARVARLAMGDRFELSRLTLSSHAGTHLDPPRHLLRGGRSVDRLDLKVLLGPCQVIEVPQTRRVVGPRDLRSVRPGVERVLLRTSNSERWARRLRYFGDAVGLSRAGARHLAGLGVRLVGIDALSIEAGRGVRLPVHRELLARGVVVLEGLLLVGVRAGRYELTCLPLRLRGGDGAPARAILRGPLPEARRPSPARPAAAGPGSRRRSGSRRGSGRR